MIPPLWIIALVVGASATGPDSLRSAPPPPPELHGTLSLEQALRLALERSPRLQESIWSARAETERARDEARWANPTLELTDENFGGSLGAGHDERTLALGQPFAPGLAGARRSVLAALERRGGYELQAARREVALEAGDAFFEVWWLERRVTRLRQSETFAVSAIAAAQERTRIGAAPVTESLRARANRATQQIERRRAEADLDIARLKLASQWGATTATFDSLLLPAPDSARAPPVDTTAAGLENRPEIRRASAETAIAAARVRAARAARIPEVTVSGGVRSFAENSETAFLAGVSLPIPIWNSGRARISAAEADYQVALARERTLRIALRQELASAWRRMLAARDDYEVAVRDGRPAAREALEKLAAGYRAGRFTYLDFVEGQRAELEVELSALDAVREYWSARFALEWGAGTSLLPADVHITPEEPR